MNSTCNEQRTRYETAARYFGEHYGTGPLLRDVPPELLAAHQAELPPPVPAFW
ncbi:MAG TPA: hypothetical protein GX511_06425 [Firmicutes bacterium]|nr:hypothetical protein [Bacillota bacterium]